MVKPGDAERAAIREMVKSAKERGLDITGPDGLLKLLTKTVLETALEEEITDHLGYDKHDPSGRDGGNSRNGTRAKTVISEAVGAVTIEVPRDRDGSFTPVIVKKRQRRLGDVDKIVLSLYGKGMTTGEISAHFAEIYGVSVSKEVVSNITDKVLEEQQAWSTRPLASHYVAVFVDAIYVKVRDGAVANRPFYAAIGVDLQGRRDVLGVWAGTPGAGESAKFWISILTELKNRGVTDIFYLVCDGLKGMPESVNAVFNETTVQTCVVHLIRNTFKYSSKKYWGEIARDLKPVYTGVNAAAAAAAFESFDEKWGERYPAISKLWRAAWSNFVPFLDLDIEIRNLLSTTNAIESLNARFRRVIDARGHFPNEQAAMKVLYLAVRSIDPKGTGQLRWMMRWKPILNVLAVSFHDRMPETANL
jgi:transposase-like protein